MAFSIKRKIYESLPLPLKKALCSIPFSLWAGKDYRTVLRNGQKVEWMKRDEIRVYQATLLGEMLSYVTAQVPAYRKFRSVVEKFSPFDALKEFPFLTKEILQNRFEEFLPGDFGKIPHYQITTGGTSGNQLKFYVDDASQSTEMAFVHRLWSRVGYEPKMRKATFRGVTFREIKSGLFWQNNPIYNELQFSPFHMAEKNLNAYVEKLCAYRPEYLHGYPSAIDLLAGYILRNGLEESLPPIRAAFLVSEGFSSAQRERIEKAFKTRVFSFYGHSERLIFAGECEETQAYHHFPDYGILEIIDKESNPCEKEGDTGEIVGTGLLNRSMPLIRYRTGDFATRLEPKCKCGREHDRFTAVKGRWEQDMIIGRNGGKISIAALNMHGRMFDNVLRYQYYQDRIGHLVIKVIPTESFNESDKIRIKDKYLNKTTGELDIDVEIVKDISLTKRGKYKLFVSDIST